MSLSIPSASRRRSSRPVRQVRGPWAKARGAALTECFLSTIILVPILFGTAMLGKHIQITQSAVIASRHAVWEATVHDQGASADDVRERFFARSRRGNLDREATSVAGATGEVGDHGDDDFGSGDSTPPHAGMPARTRVSVDLAGVSTGYVESGGSDTARTFGQTVDAAGDAIGGLSGGRWDITGNGFIRGVVAVPVEANGWLAAATLEERSVIMNDGWSASGLEQLNERTRSFVPAGALKSVANVLSEAGAVPVLKELEGLRGALGKVDASGLPQPEVRTLRPYSERSP